MKFNTPTAAVVAIILLLVLVVMLRSALGAPERREKAAGAHEEKVERSVQNGERQKELAE